MKSSLPSTVVNISATAPVTLADIVALAEGARVVLTEGVYEALSQAAIAAAERAVASYRIMLACELLAVSRLLGQLDSKVSPTLADAAGVVRNLQTDHEDQDLRAPLAQASTLLDDLAQVLDRRITTQ